MGDFPFHKQKSTWTCGAAAMRMALEACGIRRSEKQVVRLLKTNKVRGTWHKEFPRVAEKYKLNYVVMRNASLKDLNELQKKGYTVIVCYYYPPEKVDHYSVLKAITSERIFFYDPWFGEGHNYSLNYFDRIWKSDPRYDAEKRWLFAVRS